MRPPAQTTVDNLDWAVIGLAGLLLAVAVAGMLFALVWGTGSIKRPSASAFAMLQRSRLLALFFAAVIALSEPLRLQLLWGPSSTVLPGGFHPTVFCRLYIGLMYGFAEPCFLLVVLFACHYAVHGSGGGGGTDGSHTAEGGGGGRRCCGRGGFCGSGGCCGSSSPNMRILHLTALYCVPMLAAQTVAALFTYMFSEPHYSASWLLRIFFASYLSGADAGMAVHCSAASSAPANCAFCTFPLLSTLSSAAMYVCYLVAFWRSTQHVVVTALSRPLVFRVRVLQVLMILLLSGSTACRGLTQLFVPWEWGFELLRVGHVLLMVLLVIAVCYIMVIKPVYDTAAADHTLARHRRLLRQEAAAAEKLKSVVPLLPPAGQSMGVNGTVSCSVAAAAVNVFDGYAADHWSVLLAGQQLAVRPGMDSMGGTTGSVNGPLPPRGLRDDEQATDSQPPPETQEGRQSQGPAVGVEGSSLGHQGGEA